MFDIWRKIEEKGSAAVPTRPESLSALEWVEVGEKYPDLVPDEFSRYDVYSDRQLIRESPFMFNPSEKGKSCRFKSSDADGKTDINVWVDPFELVSTMGDDYYHTDDEISAFGGILVCSCGIAPCAGIWSQTFHVSEKMVHWSVILDDDELEFFFEREAYEKGALAMIRALTEKPEEITLPGPDDFLEGDELESFKLNVEKMLERRTYFKKMWSEIGGEQS